MSFRVWSGAVAAVAAFGFLIPAPAQEPRQDPPREGGLRSREQADEPRLRDRSQSRDRPRQGRRQVVEPRLLLPQPEPGPGQPQRWRLGVYVDDLETGVLLTDVARPSAAARAGLEPGDTVVTVDGYQVGIVNGRHYELGEELQRRADPTGRVRLLILNHRNGRLAIRDVQLEPAGRPAFGGPGGPGRPTAVTGSVTYRERIALPDNARLVVRLIQGLPTGGPGRRPGVLGGPTPVVSERTIFNLGQVPIDFELPFDPSQLRPDAPYRIDAEITVNDRTLFRGSAPYEPDRGGGSPSVEIQLRPAGRLR